MAIPATLITIGDNNEPIKMVTENSAPLREELMRKLTSVAMAAVIGSTAALLSMTAIAPALAEYPERPVTFIVPWPPGDLEDQLTRIIADEMTKATGQPAKVVNRPGGGAVEGSNAVATADPDGYTVGSLVIDVVTTTLIKGNAPFKRDALEPVGIFQIGRAHV